MSINFTLANRAYLTAGSLAYMTTLNDIDRLAFQVTETETAHVKAQFRTSTNLEDDIAAGFPYGKWSGRVVVDNPAIPTKGWEQYAELWSPLFSGGYALRREEAALICPAFANADVALLTGHYDVDAGIFTVFGDGIFDAGGSMLLVVDQDLNNDELIQVIKKITQQLPASCTDGFELNPDTWRDVVIMPVDASFTEAGMLAENSPAVKKMLMKVAKRHFGEERGFEHHCSRNAVALTDANVVDQHGNVIEPNRITDRDCGRGVTLKVKEWDNLRKTDAVLACRTNTEGITTIEIELVGGESLEKLTTLQYRQLCVIYKRITHWAVESFQRYNLDKHRQFAPPEFPLNNVHRLDVSALL